MRNYFSLQIKQLFRSPTWGQTLWMRILVGFFVLYFVAVFLLLGIGLFFIIEELELGDPLDVVHGYMLFYVLGDLVFRYLMQKMPVADIKQYLYLPIKKGKIVRLNVFKSLFSFFNVSHLFFIIPFGIILIVEGYPVVETCVWMVSVNIALLANHFLNMLVNNSKMVFAIMLSLLLGLLSLQFYFGVDVTPFSFAIFAHFSSINSLITGGLILWVLVLYTLVFYQYRAQMYLDAGLLDKKIKFRENEYKFLERFGPLAPFLKMDLALITRNKRSKSAVIAGFLLVFYGLLFFTGTVESYESPAWQFFAGIFVTGGFLFSFGQYVPSWDSAYYPLLMSQNIRYIDYLNSKWYLVQIATIISTLLATFYLYLGWDAYRYVLLGMIYNLGINSYLVLWGGAFVKTKIDLSSYKKAFGDKSAFNYKTMLLFIPKLALPLLIYGLTAYYFSHELASIAIIVISILGFTLKKPVFRQIEKVYKKEKYTTLKAYKS